MQAEPRRNRSDSFGAPPTLAAGHSLLGRSVRCRPSGDGRASRPVAHQLADMCRGSVVGSQPGCPVARCCPVVCENFLYVFKAARRAARAAASAARLRSRCRSRSGGQAPVGWRETKTFSRAAMTLSR